MEIVDDVLRRPGGRDFPPSSMEEQHVLLRNLRDKVLTCPADWFLRFLSWLAYTLDIERLLIYKHTSPGRSIYRNWKKSTELPEV
jgi:hypothetical protein